MAKRAKPDPHAHHHAHMRKERIAYGLFISALGCLWLAAELGYFQTNVPIGPIIVIIFGFTMMLPWLKN